MAIERIGILIVAACAVLAACSQPAGDGASSPSAATPAAQGDARTRLIASCSTTMAAATCECRIDAIASYLVAEDLDLYATVMLSSDPGAARAQQPAGKREDFDAAESRANGSCAG